MVISKRLRNFKALAENLDIQISLEVFFKHLSDYIETAKGKFNESVDVCIKIGLDPKKSDQVIKSSCVLPNGSGKSIAIAVFTSSANSENFINAGAKYAGGDDLIERVLSKQLIPGKDFSLCLASPDMMVKLGKVARILGPKGLMPNAKLGTISEDLIITTSDALKGRAELRTDKLGYIRLSIGRIDFEASKIKGNLLAVYEALKAIKPATIKGTYFLELRLSSTLMGRSFAIKMSDIYNS